MTDHSPPPKASGLARQLRLLEVYAVFTYPFACVPLLYFWFRDHGVDIEQYHWLIAVYYQTMVVAEVPTGLLADRFGKRRMMILGPILLAIGMAILFGGRTFAWFCVGEIVLGLGHSVLSGPPSALLYDTLHDREQAETYLREESRIHSLRLAGTGAAFLLGGAVAEWAGIGPAILLTAGLSMLGALAAIGLEEVAPREPPRPPIMGPAPAEDAVATPRPSLFRGALRDLRQPAVLWITAYFVLVFFALRYAFHTYQPFLAQLGVVSPLVLGALYCGLNVIAAPCSRLAPRLQESIGPRLLFAAIPVLLGGALLIQAFALAPGGNPLPILGITLLIAHQVPFGIHWPIIQAFANHRIQREVRATVLSMMSFVGRLLFAGLFPLIGILHEADGIEAAYQAVGWSTLGLTAVCLLAGRSLLVRPQ